jgi:hypothetical protein
MLAMIFTTLTVVMLLSAVGFFAMMALGLWRLDYGACRFPLYRESQEGKQRA